MCVTAIMAGASIIGGLAQASAAKSAANAQTAAANRQIKLQRDIYKDQRKLFRPYRQTGRIATNALNYELGLRADAPKNYQGFQATPGYQFALDQGIGAIDASAASRGNLLSGATLQDLQEYGTGLANQEYGTYLDRLYGQANLGQASVAGTAAAGQNFATGTSNALANIGNAQAAGAVGVGNAVSGMTNNLSSALMMQQLLQ